MFRYISMASKDQELATAVGHVELTLLLYLRPKMFVWWGLRFQSQINKEKSQEKCRKIRLDVITC